MKLVAGALVLGRKFAALTEPGERVGVLLPNVNAAAVAFFALQAFGRVPAMLNFSAGPGQPRGRRGHGPDQAGDLLGRVRRQGQARALDRRPSAATPSSSGSRTCAARSRPRDRLRGLWDGLFAQPHPPARFGVAARRPGRGAVHLGLGGPAEGRRAQPRQHPGQLRPDLGPGRLQPARQGVQRPAGVPQLRPDRRHAAADAWAASRSTCTPRRCTTGSSRSWSTTATSTIIFGTNSFLKGYGTHGRPVRFPLPALRLRRGRGDPGRDAEACGSTSSACASSTGYGATETAPGALARTRPCTTAGARSAASCPASSTGSSPWPGMDQRRPAVGQGPQRHAGLPALRAARRAAAARGRLVRHRRHRRPRRRRASSPSSAAPSASPRSAARW